MAISVIIYYSFIHSRDLYRSGHSVGSDTVFKKTICVGKYPGKYLCLWIFNETMGFFYYLVGLTIIIPLR